ncbi:META domain-containing protein [Seonamhaeicola marinus]|nr:META domain-containing protein [Seonamhaeicola marinus]
MLDSQNNSTAVKDLNGKYNVVHLNDRDVSSYNLNISFNKATQQASGFSGCNRFFGSYSIDGNSLNFGEMGATKMLCQDDKNTIESSFFKALGKANTILFNKSGFSLFQNKKLLLIAEKEQTSFETISFEYSAVSRGSYQFIKLNNKSISFQNTRNGNPQNVICKKEQWTKIINASKSITFKNISNLEAPSQKRLFDGAAIAKLKVIVDGKTYETPSFDHGNPHPEIANLVKEILSLAQNVE